jgi:spore coat protein U-like protein
MKRFAVLLFAAVSGAVAAKNCPPQPASCEVAAPLYTFGRQEMTDSTPPILAQGTASITCTKLIQQGFPVTISLELSGIPPRVPRELRAAQGQLNYGLFLDPPHTLVWGDGSAGTHAIEDTIELKGNTRTVTRNYMLYGQVDGGQQADAGRYLDAVAVRLRYTTSCN